jgi:hypothetical protein
MLTTLTLADGAVYTRKTSARRFWKSRLMDLTPYGTDFRGCTFTFAPEGTS